MNVAFILGLVTAFFLFTLGLFGETQAAFFLDPHALIVVVGGTVTAALFSTSFTSLFRIFKGSWKMMLLGKNNNAGYITRVIGNVIDAAKASKSERGALANLRGVHPLLTEGFRMIADGILSEPEMREVLVKRMEFYRHLYLEDARVLGNLAKFPPAFGLLGAVTGMIGMMSKLSGGADSIGKSMAVALVATFWGITVANVFLLPLSDYYKKLAEDDTFIRRVIIDGLLMLKRKEAIPLIEEKMNSYLPPNRRIQSGGTGASGGSFKKAA